MTQACAPLARTVRETLPGLRAAASRSLASPGVSRVSLLAISNAAWQLLSGCDHLIWQMVTLRDGFQDRYLIDPITSSYPARRSIGFRQAQARRGLARGGSGEFRRRRLAPRCSRSGRLPRAPWRSSTTRPSPGSSATTTAVITASSARRPSSNVITPPSIIVNTLRVVRAPGLCFTLHLIIRSAGKLGETPSF